MSIEVDYITHSVLEVLSERPNKKFYPQEILDDILENPNICHDVFDFTLDAIMLGLAAQKTLKSLFSYIISDENIIYKCKKFKKDAYQIADAGMHIHREYKIARKFYIAGFTTAMMKSKCKTHDDYINSLANNAWCCKVCDEFAKIMERAQQELEGERILKEGF